MTNNILVPPLNFAQVEPGVYRSGFPNKKNMPFLEKLGLKTIIYLSADDYLEEMSGFCKDHDIRLIHYRVDGNKEPFQEISHEDMAQALTHVLDVRNHPMLIHCNKGKSRVGCLVGCLRKLQNWSLTSIFDEYRMFSGLKIRIVDQEFIEVYDHTATIQKEFAPSWL